MSSVLIKDGGLVVQDPSDIKVYTFDWDTYNLAVGATISTSTFSITPIQPSTSDAALTLDQPSILTGGRKTQLRLTAGTLGQLYEVANKIVTSESPTQTKERSFFVTIENR